MSQHEKIITEVEGVATKAYPFKIMAKPNNDTLAILVHGFSGSPYSLRPLAEHLVDLGIDIEVPLLAGHGGSLERLIMTRHADWVDSVEKILVKNIDKYSRIFLVGYSFGANIALHLANKYPQIISGVISLGVFIYKRREFRSRLLLPIVKFFPKLKYTRDWDKAEKSKLADIGKHFKLPMSGIVSVADFIDRYTKKEVSRVNVPVLVIHSRDDEVSHPRGSEFLFNSLKIKDKNLFILNKQEHNPSLNSRRDFLYMKIFNFIKNH